MSLVRRALALVPLLLFACAAPAGDDPGSDESAVESARPRLLALGDSITFAWNPHVEKDLTKVDPKKYPGYTDVLGKRLGLGVDNAACPGETSGAMLDARAEDNGCRENRATYPMHYDWSTPTGDAPATQIELARTYLEEAVAAGRAPELITMTIGGNDLLLLKKHCQHGILSGGCQLLHLPFTVHAFGEHIQKLIAAIDATGYTGTLVIVSTYAPDYSDAIAKLALVQMNKELAEHVGEASRGLHGLRVRIADAYGAFEKRAQPFGGKTCETGLLIKNDDGKTCDIHPTAAGHEVIADAIQEAIGR